MEAWMTKQIWSVIDIMDGNGNILELNDCNSKYKHELLQKPFFNR